jgi:phage-related baseplate assembly protein
MTSGGFGVTDDGFVLKGFDTILGESLTRARQVLGEDLDTSPTSTLYKIIEVTAAEDAELWKRLEDAYYANFVATAPGDALDLLGADLGVGRRESFAGGAVEFTLSGAVAGRQYVVPEGTVVVTAPPVRSYATTEPLVLTADRPAALVPVLATERGLADLPADRITGIDPAYLEVFFGDLGPATLSVRNPEPLTGGRVPEPHDAYRGRMLGYARTIWTLEAVQQAVLDVDGVLDVLLSDPLGGVDVSQSYFGNFSFSQRQFSAERRIGEPYFFDVVVAHEFHWPWHTTGSVQGVADRVREALDRVRPPGVHPNVVEADHIDVGVRARVVIEPGRDGAAMLASIRRRLAGDVPGLRLGVDVLYSQVVCAFLDEPGVVDVQRLHLRRHPAAFGRISFGAVAHQTGPVEAGIGENLVMGPTELAVFGTDPQLDDIELVVR